MIKKYIRHRLVKMKRPLKAALLFSVLIYLASLLISMAIYAILGRLFEFRYTDILALSVCLPVSIHILKPRLIAKLANSYIGFINHYEIFKNECPNQTEKDK